ncbi:ceramide glucosyltransferase [Paragemmobacter ruber]|uniref:Glycosyltransferase n=1 Tax=Paragemmobacter ruber TaxID=1985673 RepID=A0ABW9YAX0_9RHOB|nr:ceramide glucosyltransferase [Rhodobacter ruber]NBE09567.1 glycosyltransferase [Rhodobacter ruber]
MELALIGLAGVLLGLHLLSCAVVGWRLRRPLPPRVDAAPFVTLLRPVCGLDPLDAETLGSSFALDYPAFEVIFCVADADDPVVPLVEGLIAAHPGVAARLLIGEARVSANPKLNNLEKGWQAARGAWVVMADSNLLLRRDYLWQLLAARGPEVGLVSSPPVGVRPEGAWAELECAFLNSNQARLQLLADSLGFGFAQGKTLMWERAFLAARGGLAPLGQRLAEDVASTRLVRGAGKRVALTQRPFAQPIGRRTLRQVWARQLRWAKVRREGFPLLFPGEVLNGSLVALVAALAGGGAGVAAGVAVVWYGAEMALALACGWVRPGRALVMLPLRDLMLPALWVASYGNTTFEWRGNAMAPGALRKMAG